jgi:hypothetical protein
MSVVTRNLINRNEVETMSTTTISQQSCTTVTRRPAVDVLAEKLARRLLAWSDRRQEMRSQEDRGKRSARQSVQPSHERMALIRENERLRQDALGVRSASPVAR